MNLPIRFRAWSRVSKKFVYGFLGQWFFDASPNPNGLDGMEDGTDLQILDLEPWQQFTGLTDKNGKDVYEGDILDVGEVVWVEEAAAFRYNSSRSNKDISFTESPLNHDEVEIIGNIYEHGDLLK